MRLLRLLCAAAIAAGCAASGKLAVEPFPEGRGNTPGCAERPAALVRGEPAYPPAARADFQPGWVIVEYDIDENGSTTNIGVVRSSPPEIFDGAARRAIREWRYAANAPRQKCRMDFRFNAR